jgi:uncharacterized protein (UPF0333 family)
MNIFSLAILEKGVGGMSFQLRDNRGQALLEFALVLPVLLLLVFGIIEFGLIFFDNLVITQAAREGARVGVVGGSDAEIIETIEYSAASLDQSRLQIEIEPGQTVRSDNKKFTFPEKIQKQNLLADKQPYKQSLASNLRLQTSDSIYRVNTYAAVVYNHQK